MGFFSKLQPLASWTNDDLREEIHKLTAKIAREPWDFSNSVKLQETRARHKEYEVKIDEMKSVLASRGLGEFMSSGELMAKLKRPN